MCGGEGNGQKSGEDGNFVIQVANYDNQGRTVTEEISIDARRAKGALDGGSGAE